MSMATTFITRLFLFALTAVYGLQAAGQTATDPDAHYAQRFSGMSGISYEQGKLVLYGYRYPSEPASEGGAAIALGIMLTVGGFFIDEAMPRFLCWGTGLAFIGGGVLAEKNRPKVEKPKPEKITYLTFDSQGLHTGSSKGCVFTWAQYYTVDVADAWETEWHTDTVQDPNRYYVYDPHYPNGYRPIERTHQQTTARQVFKGQVATFRGQYGERLWEINERDYKNIMSLSDLIDTVQYYKGRYGN